MMAFSPELGMILHQEMRDGNVPASTDVPRIVEETLELLPDAITHDGLTCPCLETVDYTRGQEDAHVQSTHQGEQVMSNHYTFIGLHVHKDTVAVAVAQKGKAAPDYHGVIKNDAPSLRRLLTRLSPDEAVISFYYEAGPSGNGIYREITKAGHDCVVVAPSLIPRV